jgi:hypothetical protein
MDPVTQNRANLSGPARCSLRQRRWPTVARILVATIVVPVACTGEGYLQIRGKAVSAADRAPVPDAEVRMYVDRPDAWSKSCEELDKPYSDVRTDAAGKFETQAYMYQGGCSSSSCKQGVLCISHVGFATLRRTFDDCNHDEIVDRDNLIFELTPAP